jgi:hypothetical protein
MKLLTLLFVFISFALQAKTPEQILESDYLPQFISMSDRFENQGLPSWMIDVDTPEVGPLKFMLRNNEVKSVPLSDLDLRRYLTKIYAAHFPPSTVLQNEDLAYHLQVFGIAEYPHLYEILFPTQTLFGEVYGAYLLTSGPTQDVETIYKRQTLIRTLRDNTKLRHTLAKHLDTIHEIESTLIDLFHPENTRKWESLRGAINLPQFLFQNYGTTLALSFAPYTMKTLFSGFFSFERSTCLNCLSGTCRRLGTLMFSCVEMFSYFIQGQYLYLRHNDLMGKNALISDRLRALHRFMGMVSAIDKIEGLPEELHTHNDADLSDKIYDLYNTLDGIIDCADSHLFQANLVRAKNALEKVLELQNHLENMMLHIGNIDLYVAVAETLAEDDTKLSFVRFVDREHPFVEAKGLIHPRLINARAIANSVSLGKDQPNTMILTGPNASGKSTLMRALGINIIYLAQVLGLATIEDFVLTPVSVFHAYMESKDVTGKSSSYETDIDRIVELIHLYKTMNRNEKSFLLIDEILSSTNSREALEGSKILLEELVRYSQTQHIVSTHLYGLSELGEQSPELFHNQHMEILRKEGKLEFTYHLKEGKSTESNALDIVRKEFAEFIQGVR